MKVSVSLPDEDIEYLDAYVSHQGLASRSAGLQKAVSLLRASELGGDYEAAWAEWADSGEAEVWESTAADGLAE